MSTTPGDENDPLTTAAAEAGAPYGMTAGQVLAYILTGDVRHADAPPDECDAVDPRDKTRWCRRPPDHQEANHCCYPARRRKAVQGKDRRQVALSDDARKMTITEATPAGAHRITLARAGNDDPFGDDDIQRALEMVRPVLMLPGQRNMTRRWVTPLGSLYVHLMLGPPTWRLPKVQVCGGLMVGWLRAAVAVKFHRLPAR